MKNRFFTRPVIIPLLLLVYLVVMFVLGWPNYRAGGVSGTIYFGGTAVTIACIIALRYNLLRAERRRKNRGRDS